jgi:hypothetical protein
LAGVLTIYTRGRSFTSADQALLETLVRTLAPSFHRQAGRVPAPPWPDPAASRDFADGRLLERLIEAERAAGHPLFPTLGVLCVQSGRATDADLPAAWIDTVRDAARAGDIVLHVSPARALLLMPDGERATAERMLAACERDGAAAARGAELRARFAVAPEDGQGLRDLVRVAERRFRDTAAHRAPSFGSGPATGEERLAS